MWAGRGRSWVGQGGDAGGQPDADDGAGGAWQRGDGVRAQRVTDGRVALDRERRDGQDRRRRRRLGEERLEEAVRLAESPRVRLPDRVQLRRKTFTAQRCTGLRFAAGGPDPHVLGPHELSSQTAHGWVQ